MPRPIAISRAGEKLRSSIRAPIATGSLYHLAQRQGGARYWAAYDDSGNRRSCGSSSGRPRQFSSSGCSCGIAHLGDAWQEIRSLPGWCDCSRTRLRAAQLGDHRTALALPLRRGPLPHARQIAVPDPLRRGRSQQRPPRPRGRPAANRVRARALQDSAVRHRRHALRRAPARRHRPLRLDPDGGALDRRDRRAALRRDRPVRRPAPSASPSSSTRRDVPSGSRSSSGGSRDVCPRAGTRGSGAGPPTSSRVSAPSERGRRWSACSGRRSLIWLADFGMYWVIGVGLRARHVGGRLLPARGSRQPRARRPRDGCRARQLRLPDARRARISSACPTASASRTCSRCTRWS